jgi:predicted RNase H-like HicB family nuclease
MKVTAIIEESEDGWFVGQIGEFPAALSQGKTIPELKANLLDALYLLMEANRSETDKEYIGRSIQKEELIIS